jgi:NAD(P)H-dependent FMN reductase
MIVFEFVTPLTAPATVAPRSRSARRLLDEVQFLLVPGSTRPASDDNVVLRAADAFLPHSRVLRSIGSLPQFNPDRADRPPAVVEVIRRQLSSADVVVFCTPEYAGSLPGSLKNLIDWTLSSGELHGKPVAWINTGGSGPGAGASAALADVLGHVGAIVVEPGGLHLPLEPGTIGLDGEIADAGYRLQLEHALVGLAGTLPWMVGSGRT